MTRNHSNNKEATQTEKKEEVLPRFGEADYWNHRYADETEETYDWL